MKRAHVPHEVFTMPQGRDKIDDWCVAFGGTSTHHATYSESECFDIVPCNVKVESYDDASQSFICKKMGKRKITALDEKSGQSITLADVLIHESFPFHIISGKKFLQCMTDAGVELSAGDKDTLHFYEADGRPLLPASQSLIEGTSANNDGLLYFLDEQKALQTKHAPVATHSYSAMVQRSVPTISTSVAQLRHYIAN